MRLSEVVRILLAMPTSRKVSMLARDEHSCDMARSSTWASANLDCCIVYTNRQACV